MMATEAYLEKKLAGVCTYHRCQRMPAEGAQLCPRHLVKQRMRDARYKRRLRARRRDAGLCAFCRAKSKTYRCMACLIKAGLLPTRNVQFGVDKSARVAAQTRKHEDGRVRYHGQAKRGQQPTAQLNAQDLAMASDCFRDFGAGLAMLESDDVKALPRVQRDNVRSAVCHEGERVSRHLDDILERLGHFKVRHGRRDGE
jgi:hypothetical protein